MFKLINSALISMLLAGPAVSRSEPVCMDTTKLEAALVDWYAEKPVQQIDEGVYLWASNTGGTWSIVRHYKDGVSCTLNHGDDWRGTVQSNENLALLD